MLNFEIFSQNFSQKKFTENSQQNFVGSQNKIDSIIVNNFFIFY